MIFGATPFGDIVPYAATGYGVTYPYSGWLEQCKDSTGFSLLSKDTTVWVNKSAESPAFSEVAKDVETWSALNKEASGFTIITPDDNETEVRNCP